MKRPHLEHVKKKKRIRRGLNNIKRRLTDLSLSKIKIHKYSMHDRIKRKRYRLSRPRKVDKDIRTSTSIMLSKKN